MAAQGETKTTNGKQAYQWLLRSAEMSYPQAQLMLGRAYETGRLGERNIAKAVNLYQLAAEQGLAEAAVEYATALYLGRGALQNLSQAGEWYLRAARAGDVDAQTVVARMHETGEGLPQDERLARSWYQSAAKLGDLPSQAKMFQYETLDKAAAAPTMTPPAAPSTLAQPSINK